ncbi:MAG: mechanosensitive ion channel [Oscillospiraceae bacterium]|nr:mechanosensitive ion channel [Oscillospiraceae bacterium]
MSNLTLGGYALSTLITAALSLVICLIAMKVVTNVVGKVLSRSTKLDGTLQNFIRSAIKAILWVLTAIIVANALGIPTASLVALVSVAGLALSLSVQNLLSNLFSGITLLVNKPFATGDFVEIAGKTGVVRNIGLFYTKLDTLDNVAISIPNGDVTGASVVDYSTEPMRRVDMYFSAAYDEPTEKVKAAIQEVIDADERIVRDPAPFVRLFEYKGSAISYVVRVWCKNADYWDVYFDLNENVRESFARNGVAMSYEHVNVHVVEK